VDASLNFGIYDTAAFPVELINALEYFIILKYNQTATDEQLSLVVFNFNFSSCSLMFS
jgi:hypothetical protein